MVKELVNGARVLASTQILSNSLIFIRKLLRHLFFGFIYVYCTRMDKTYCIVCIILWMTLNSGVIYFCYLCDL